MWCRKCNMETNGQTCPVCGSETVEDLPTEIFWCKGCQTPIIYNTNAADKGICPICGKKTRYMAQDLRPVFPEERLLMAVLLDRDSDEFMQKPVWSQNSRYYVGDKSFALSTTLFQTADTIANYVTVFSSDPMLKNAIRFNLLTERIDMVGELGWHRHGTMLTDMDLHHLQYFCEHIYGLSNDKKLRSALNVVANQNRFHPIQERLESLKWDGIHRIRQCLHHFLGAAEDDYTEEVFRHVLLGAIRRIFQPGCKYEEVLVLVGGQGIGKSTFLRFLAMEDEWFTDDIRRLDDEKVFQRLQGHWIVEICEMLATNNAKSVEESRSFFSRQKDTYRVPYETQPQDRLRQCIFAGTSNSYDFLPLDRAGNRRFLPVKTDGNQAEVHILKDEKRARGYIEQVWAEAMALYRADNYSMKFSPAIAEKLIEVQKSFMPEDVEAGQILDWLDRTSEKIVCCRMLHELALGRTDEPKKWQLHAYAEIMRNYAGDQWRYFENPRQFGRNYGRQKGWERVIPTVDHAVETITHEQTSPGMQNAYVETQAGQDTQKDEYPEWFEFE